MSKDTKEWLEFAVVLVIGATVVAAIGALSNEDFATSWVYALVALATLAGSGVVTVMLYSKWEVAPALWYLAYLFIIAPACLAIAFSVVDSIVGK